MAGAPGVTCAAAARRLLTEVGTISHTWGHDLPTRGTASIIATFRGAAPN